MCYMFMDLMRVSSNSTNAAALQSYNSYRSCDHKISPSAFKWRQNTWLGETLVPASGVSSTGEQRLNELTKHQTRLGNSPAE